MVLSYVYELNVVFVIVGGVVIHATISLMSEFHAKAEFPIEVIDGGRYSHVILVPLKALLPMLVTVGGIITSFKEPTSSNA